MQTATATTTKVQVTVDADGLLSRAETMIIAKLNKIAGRKLFTEVQLDGRGKPNISVSSLCVSRHKASAKLVNFYNGIEIESGVSISTLQYDDRRDADEPRRWSKTKETELLLDCLDNLSKDDINTFAEKILQAYNSEN